MVFHNFFTDSKPNARTLKFTSAVEPLENGKDLPGKFIFKSYSII